MSSEDSTEFSDFVTGGFESNEAQTLIDLSPQMRELGIQLIDMSPGSVVLMIPYDPRFVGDPSTGVLHGGVVTTLLDSCCGGATLALEPRPAATATLDLRIDYMRSAAPGRPVYAWAECLRVSREIAFVRGLAYDADRSDPVAAANGAFMLTPAAGVGGAS